MKNIQFHHEDVEQVSVNKIYIVSSIQNLIINEEKLTGDINIIFCSDKYLLEMNRTHLGHNYFTDIITFDYVEENVINGDLFISTERISENADTFAVEFEEELKRVIFHGVLHLVGYGDKTEEEKKAMREKENFYLELEK